MQYKWDRNGSKTHPVKRPEIKLWEEDISLQPIIKFGHPDGSVRSEFSSGCFRGFVHEAAGVVSYERQLGGCGIPGGICNHFIGCFMYKINH